jgi:hypothetical protein
MEQRESKIELFQNNTLLINVLDRLVEAQSKC